MLSSGISDNINFIADNPWPVWLPSLSLSRCLGDRPISPFDPDVRT
jgi:hypothetical protein